MVFMLILTVCILLYLFAIISDMVDDVDSKEHIQND